MSEEKNIIENEIVRINLRMSKEMKSWYEGIAKHEGIPYSAVMVMALREYMKQEKGVDFFKQANTLLNLK